MKTKHGWLAALLLLASCSGGPSASDIKAALQRVADAVMGAGIITIESVSSVDCKEAQGKPGYVCSYSVTGFNKIMNNQATQTAEGRFVEANGQWQFMKD